MTILKPGHRYIADNVDDPSYGQTIQFIEKAMVPTTDPHSPVSHTLQVVSDGTSTEEVLRVVIDRLHFLNSKVPCRENSVAITYLETGLLWLQKRTTDRATRGVEGTSAP